MERQTIKEKPVLPAPWVRFKCTECKAERDQRMRQPKSTMISCVCGGSAVKIGEPTLTPGAYDWWVLDGQYVWLASRQSRLPLEHSDMIPLPPKKSLWEKICATVRSYLP